MPPKNVLEVITVINRQTSENELNLSYTSSILDLKISFEPELNEQNAHDINFLNIVFIQFSIDIRRRNK